MIACREILTRNQDDDPGNNRHRSHTAEEIHRRHCRSLNSHDIDAASHGHDEESRNGNADILQRYIEDIGLTGRPHAADEGNPDEYDGTGEHPRNRCEDIRHEGV